MLRPTAIAAAASLTLGLAAASADTVTNLADSDATFPPGTLDSFHAKDYNADGKADDNQDMAFRFSMTTPGAFNVPGYVLVESGRFTSVSRSCSLETGLSSRQGVITSQGMDSMSSTWSATHFGPTRPTRSSPHFRQT